MSKKHEPVIEDKNLKITDTWQLYEYYHIPGGCPECSQSIVGQASKSQRLGTQNLQVTNCPHCKVGLELLIADNKGGNLVPIDLSKNKHPDAYQMLARISETTVLPLGAIMAKGGDA